MIFPLISPKPIEKFHIKKPLTFLLDFYEMVYIYIWFLWTFVARRRLDVALGAEAKRRCVEMVEEAEEEVHDRSLVAESSFVQENHGF